MCVDKTYYKLATWGHSHKVMTLVFALYKEQEQERLQLVWKKYLWGSSTQLYNHSYMHNLPLQMDFQWDSSFYVEEKLKQFQKNPDSVVVALQFKTFQ